MTEFFGLVFRQHDGTLVLFDPALGEGQPISDYEHIYANLPLAEMEVVHARAEGEQISLTSLFGTTFEHMTVQEALIGMKRDVDVRERFCTYVYTEGVLALSEYGQGVP